MTDLELSKLVDPIVSLYNEIELELIKEIAWRLLTYESIDGSLEFYIKKLDELGALNIETAKIIARYSNLQASEVMHLLKEAGFANVSMPVLNRAFELGLIADPVVLFNNPLVMGVLDNSYKELSNTLKMINTKAVEGARDEYMRVLNKAYLEVSTGVKDYNTAIKDGVMEMAKRGIRAATYVRSDGTQVNYTIEGVVRRDVLTATFQAANRGVMAEAEALGIDYIEVSAHPGARIGDGKNPISNHAAWQGKVYKIHGEDEQYENLAEVTGYGQIEGFAGVNCRHRGYLFIPGVSEPHDWSEIDSEENKKAYELSQRQRRWERRIRELKREVEVAELTGDKGLVKEYKTKLKNAQLKYSTFCKNNGLKRSYERERIQK